MPWWVDLWSRPGGNLGCMSWGYEIHGVIEAHGGNELVGHQRTSVLRENLCMPSVYGCEGCQGLPGFHWWCERLVSNDRFTCLEVEKQCCYVVRSTIGKEIPRQTWHRFYCNILQYHLAHRIMYMLTVLNPMDAASVLGDPLETKSQTL